MLKRVKSFFNDIDNENPQTPLDKNVAAAVLLVEAAAMDGEVDAAELTTIQNIIVKSFDLNKAETNELIIEAAKHQKEANHLLHFTRAIKDHYSEEERIELIEMLWEVVYTDGLLHDYEANLLRRIGGLIYVSDRDRGDARKRVMAKLGIEE